MPTKFSPPGAEGNSAPLQLPRQPRRRFVDSAHHDLVGGVPSPAILRVYSEDWPGAPRKDPTDFNGAATSGGKMWEGGGREREQGAELECRPPCTPVAAKGGKPGLQYDTYVMFE